jgi:exonuclease VII small subunit
MISFLSYVYGVNFSNEQQRKLLQVEEKLSKAIKSARKS